MSDRNHDASQAPEAGEPKDEPERGFARRAIHDFNNLLVGVLGNARLALLDLAPDNPARAHVEAIKAAAERAAGLARQLFTPGGRSSSDPPAQPATGAEDEKRLVLLIDDQAEVRRSVSGLLERSGYAVAAAEDGEQGLRVLREQGDAIDIVLLDLHMPGLSGAEVFETIRSTRPSLPVVLASGYGEVSDDPRLVDQPNTTFLGKPFRLAQLVESLSSLLDAPAS